MSQVEDFVGLCKALSGMGVTSVSWGAFSAKFEPPKGTHSPAPADLPSNVPTSQASLRAAAMHRIKTHPVSISEGLAGLPPRLREALTDEDLESLEEAEYVP